MHRQEIIQCRQCPRLVEWREKIAREKVRRFMDCEYWGKPVPGFGNPQASLLLIGLAPAAHGANRTGRMFTGDRSGDWLYRALHKADFANQPTSTNREDGLLLYDTYITALCKCAPPANKPTREEFSNCAVYLHQEMTSFLNHQPSDVSGKAILCLGQLAYQHSLAILAKQGVKLPQPRLKFRHGLELRLSDSLYLICSYHPSQQNTFTGVLTEDMLDNVFQRIKDVIDRA